MGEVLQKSNLTFEELYEEARQSVAVLADAGKTLIAFLEQENPGLFAGVEFETGPLKRPERAQAKIASDYGGDCHHITDLARGRIVVDRVEQVRAIRDYLESHRDELHVQACKDRFAKPSDSHYRDINVKIQLFNGHVCEIQINQGDILRASKKTHDAYERVQEIERVAEREGRLMTEMEALERWSLMTEIRNVHDTPARKSGLDDLLSAQGREKLEADEAGLLEIENARFESVYKTIPQEISGDMPPEVQSLAELKRMIVSQERAGKDPALARQMFKGQYDDLCVTGGLGQVMGYLCAQSPRAAPDSPKKDPARRSVSSANPAP